MEPLHAADPPGADLVRRDLAVVWHPCTQMKDHEALPPVAIRRGRGVWLEGVDGRRYLDAIGSWWVSVFGHCHPEIVAAVQRQAAELEHVMLAGFTHGPAVELAERLVRLAPAGLTRCFYADSGSAAIEIAVKMSFHHWKNVGRPKKRRFVTLANSYHGETLGALAVGSVDLYKEIYRPLLMDVLTAPSPDCYEREPGESWEAHSRRRFEPMRALLETHADEIAAVIVEPLVQCAGQMRMYHPVYLQLLRETCDRLGVHLIADEIAVGLGRTGTTVACEHAGVRPDFLCLSKGLTGGWLPASVVLTTEAVYEAFYDDYVKRTAFLHSHTYSGNPLACAAGLATLDLLERPATRARIVSLGEHLERATAPLAEHPNVTEVRRTGTLVAIEFARDRRTREPFPWVERRGLRAYRHALSRGVLLRPIGNVLYYVPPYVITDAEVDFLVEVTRECLDVACA
ncbi:MAG: adenosylmethionine--8-amino-7-oxononanoate transaminase [Pseudomonadota bacterium]